MRRIGFVTIVWILACLVDRAAAAETQRQACERFGKEAAQMDVLRTSGILREGAVATAIQEQAAADGIIGPGTPPNKRIWLLSLYTEVANTMANIVYNPAGVDPNGADELMRHECLYRNGLDQPEAAAQHKPPPDPGPQPTATFKVGYTDHEDFDAWLSRLSGDFREGVVFWSAQRNLEHPASCSPFGAKLGDWTRGCLEAQRRLASVEDNRRTYPEYQRGWDSFIPSGSSRTSAAAPFAAK